MSPAIQALTRFLIAKGNIDEGQFEKFLTAVDAEDGLIDGKITSNQAARIQIKPSQHASKPKNPRRDLQ